jgi:alkylated DNA repair dioxygenase AlkB
MRQRRQCRSIRVFGKSMPPWSPTVRANALAVARSAPRRGSSLDSSQHYNACLLNLYPDGTSEMRFHCDPDQGTKWDYDTAVVSLGAAWRFAIRPIPWPCRYKEAIDHIPRSSFTRPSRTCGVTVKNALNMSSKC